VWLIDAFREGSLPARATDPVEMMNQQDAVGPENNSYLVQQAYSAGVIVAAWGVHGQHRQRDEQVRAMFPNLHVLRLTKGGMCCVCVHGKRLCNHLNFATMPTLQIDDKFRVVKCSEFNRTNEEKVMPDIAMCKNLSCPSFGECYRAQAVPSEHRQAYMFYAPNSTGKCDDFIRNKKLEADNV